MKIVGFTCCVNYVDIFSIVYHFNKDFFDDYIVVTSSKDLNTQFFCSINNIKCIVSDSYKKNGAKFNKAAMLNEVLKIIYCDKKFNDYWKLSLDADIAINNINFDKNQKLNSNYIYGIKRRMIFPSGFSKLDKANPAARTGYFQMYFKTLYFDEKCLDASLYDTYFFENNFSKRNSFVFHEKDIISYHIGPIAKNWKGRITQCLTESDKYEILTKLNKIFMRKGPEGFVFCAYEDESCTFDVSTDLAYGSEDSFNFLYNQKGTIKFNNETFGDPAPCVRKLGFYKEVKI